MGSRTTVNARDERQAVWGEDLGGVRDASDVCAVDLLGAPPVMGAGAKGGQGCLVVGAQRAHRLVASAVDGQVWNPSHPSAAHAGKDPLKRL